jgi:chorismate synthase
MAVEGERPETAVPFTRPRPGHADLAGGIKYNQRDLRNVLERASARETACRVALGAVCKRFLEELGVFVGSYVVSIGTVQPPIEEQDLIKRHQLAEQSELRFPDPSKDKDFVELINRAKKMGESLGGVFEVFAVGVPPGLGSHVHWDRKLDGRIAQAMMSIQAIKGVEIGLGFEASKRFGSEVHDEIGYREGEGYFRYYQRHAYNCAMCHEAHTHLNQTPQKRGCFNKRGGEGRKGENRCGGSARCIGGR